MIVGFPNPLKPLEAPQQQPGARHQDEREGDLADHERRAKPALHGTGSRTRALAERN